MAPSSDSQSSDHQKDMATRNKRLALSMFMIVFGMVGLSFASVPLYRIFCQITGIGGTTQVADAAPDVVLDRRVTVQFNTMTAPDLPWNFYPLEKAVSIQVGESRLTAYEAINQSDRYTAGMATFNVTPLKAGKYFNKVQCFCFENQPLEAGQTAQFPVSFFVDPAFVDDPDMDDVTTITLSYTFFPLKDNASSANPVMAALP